MTNPFCVLKTSRGVRYRVPERRPVCSSVPKQGSHGVSERATGLVIRRLKFATARGTRIMSLLHRLPFLCTARNACTEPVCQHFTVPRLSRRDHARGRSHNGSPNFARICPHGSA